MTGVSGVAGNLGRAGKSSALPSREGANPKFEAVSNGQESESSKEPRFEFCLWYLGLCVCFGPGGRFRYPDFVLWRPGAI